MLLKATTRWGGRLQQLGIHIGEMDAPLIAADGVRQTEYHLSALTDRAAVYNHNIDWEGVKLRAKDSDSVKRGIREGICIIKAGPRTINHVEGCHHLPDMYDKLLPFHLGVAFRSTDDDV